MRRKRILEYAGRVGARPVARGKRSRYEVSAERRRAYKLNVAPSKFFGFPAVLKFNFVTQINPAVTTAGGFQDHVLYANSINDPFAALSAVQPRFHDQFAAIYGQYVVQWAKLEIWASTDAPNYNPIRVCVYVDTNAAAATSFNTSVCQPGAKMITLDNIGTENFYGVTKKMTKFGNTMKITNRPLYGSDMSAAFGADPTKMWYFHVSYYDDEAQALDVKACYRITQYTHCYEPLVGALG